MPNIQHRFHCKMLCVYCTADTDWARASAELSRTEPGLRLSSGQGELNETGNRQAHRGGQETSK